jgi:PAS domain S-box-containing protein
MGEAWRSVDLDFRFVSVNPAFSRITGYAEDEVLGQPVDLLDSAAAARRVLPPAARDAERGRPLEGRDVAAAQGRRGVPGWIELSTPSRRAGERSHYVAVVSRHHRPKRAEQELRYLANYDTLTGLPNRSLLGERLARAVVRARRQGTRVGVLFLDLDRFKDINDSMGHAAGDRILKAAGGAPAGDGARTDTVARLGGDEFTVVLEDLADRRAAEEDGARASIKAFIAAAGGRRPQRDHHLALDRHQPVPRPRAGADRPAEVRRHRDVPGQGSRPQHLAPSTTRAMDAERGAAPRMLAALRARSIAASSTWCSSRKLSLPTAASPASRRCCAGTAPSWAT